ncbi:UDP-glucose--hexose-1-phosphate uridylyltransferase [Candidatus Gottesmanbacteria bacterium]|nr:UDP-glucose--hexose-1-phosphate uridylyltransferase [Candidatus Gottesmanbacteria bacterium]
MIDLSATAFPHRRYNPLLKEWVLVSAQRMKRPWKGNRERKITPNPLKFDPLCYLCPGNKRTINLYNPQYKNIFIFDNDFPALLPDTPNIYYKEYQLLNAQSEKGICRVICYSPRHDLTLATMETKGIEKIAQAWKQQYEELSAYSFIKYVQIFENHGEMMGTSNFHPHGQIWASSSIPTVVMREQESQYEYYDKHKQTLLSDYLALELKEKIRIIFENAHFVVLVPFWATWPFETLIISRKPYSSILQLNKSELSSLADALKQITVSYNRLFNISFPYSMGIHQSPTDGKNHEEWHFHMHFFPPLLRGPAIRKFMVGYEMFAESQRDITPEEAAKLLRKSTKI